MSIQDVPTVFIVDDDREVRESLQELLESVGLHSKSFGTAQEFGGEMSRGISCDLQKCGAVPGAWIYRRVRNLKQPAMNGCCALYRRAYDFDHQRIYISTVPAISGG